MSVAQVLLVGAEKKMTKNKAELKAILSAREDIEPKNLAIKQLQNNHDLIVNRTLLCYSS